MNAPKYGIEKTFGAGEVVIAQDLRPEWVYWVVEGKLQTSVIDARGQTKILGDVYEGEVFGEMAAITGKPASATVKTLTPCILRCISHADFFELIEADPDWNRAILRTITLRSQRIYQSSKHSRAIWVSPWSIGFDVLAFMKGWMPCLEQYCKCNVVQHADWSGLAEDEATSRLAALQLEFDVVFLLGNVDAPDWDRFCAQKAELQLCVAMAADKPLPQPGMRASAAELVLLHPNRNATPRGTRAWLATGDFSMHYHLVHDAPADQKRLARCVTGHAIGMVCSGGGTRGAAHLGLIQAFEDNGIALDYLIGTSSGALMTVCHCMGMARETSISFLEEIIRNGKKMNDYTFPILSLIAGRQFHQMLLAYAGEWQIEDLWLPFACVSASLTSGKVAIHREGSLYTALRASTAIPGLLPPVAHNGDILVDGGVLDNAPTGVAQLFPAGKVILSDIASTKPLVLKGEFPTTTSGWRLLWRAIIPFYRKRFAPSLPTILLRTFEMAADALQAEKINQHPPDLHIQVPLEGYGTLDYKAVRQIQELGYAHGLSLQQELARLGMDR